LPTFGLSVLALLAQDTGVANGAASSDFVTLLLRSSPLAKAVLLILVLFSVTSWAIALLKFWQFRRAERQTASFLDVFRRSTKFSEVQAVCRTLSESPLVGLFQAGYAELNTQLRQGGGGAPAEARSSSGAGRPTLKSVEALDRALLRGATTEVNKLEHRLPFLATTASITPFIGLFGTVWGIMAAFSEIGRTGSTDLAAVAPGIAEALIATAMGLFAAIPAVYFYNHFTHHVKLFVSAMEDFSLEFLNISERNFT
jgi:biopolymer transport protein TolQ